MKKMHERETEGDQEEIGSQGGKSQGTQEEPEGEPGLNAVDGMSEQGDAEDEVEKMAMDVDPEDDAPDTTYPSLDTYQQKWDRSFTQHSKAVPGEFSHANLSRVVAKLSTCAVRRPKEQRCRVQAIEVPSFAWIHASSLRR